MDTSQDYILMCKEAIEIQGIFVCEFNVFNFIWNREHEVRCSLCEVLCDSNYCSSCGGETKSGISEGYLICEDEMKLKEPSIWLPRQDQLQDMEKRWGILNTLQSFIEWYSGDGEYGECLGSMEQLWLAYVMQKLYNKKWNKKEWVV